MKSTPPPGDLKESPSRGGRGAILAIAALLLASGNAMAGGPWRFTIDGKPYRWDASRPIVVNPDRGRLGKYGNDDAINRLIIPALARWASVPTAHVRFSIGASLPRDVQNYQDADWALASGYTPVIFDTDGTILTQIGVSPRAVIALTNFIIPRFDTITQGYIVVNGCFVDGDPSNEEMTEQEMVSSLAHEIGHLLNLHHSQVNGHMFLGRHRRSRLQALRSAARGFGGADVPAVQTRGRDEAADPGRRGGDFATLSGGKRRKSRRRCRARSAAPTMTRGSRGPTSSPATSTIPSTTPCPPSRGSATRDSWADPSTSSCRASTKSAA